MNNPKKTPDETTEAALERINGIVHESLDAKVKFFARHTRDVERAAQLIIDALKTGHKLLLFGNGGSACDAQHVAVEFTHPIVEKRRALPALALGSDVALVTAIGNDGDFAQVFAVQLQLVARDVDIVLGISTSGTSPNVIRGMRVAREAGALTVAFAGRDGGPLADLCEHAFVVPSWSIHRTQEVHTVLLHLLWDQVHVALGEPDVL